MTFLVQCWFNGPRITKLFLLEESLNVSGTPLLRSIQVRWPLQRKVTEPEGTTMGCTKQRCSTLTTCTSCPSARLVPWPLRGLGTHSWLSKSFHASFLLHTLDFRDSTLSPSHFSASKAGYVCSFLPRIYLTPGRSSSVLIRAGPSTGWLNRSPHLLSGFILKPLSSPVNLPLSSSMWIMFIHKHVLVSPLYLTEQAFSLWFTSPFNSITQLWVNYVYIQAPPISTPIPSSHHSNEYSTDLSQTSPYLHW